MADRRACEDTRNNRFSTRQQSGDRIARDTPAFERLAQHRPPALEPIFQGARRQGQPSRCFFSRQPLEVTQDHRLSKCVRQTGQLLVEDGERIGLAALRRVIQARQAGLVFVSSASSGGGLRFARNAIRHAVQPGTE
jgi:hypothetical protein